MSDKLLSHYWLYETAGTVADDATGNARDGTYVGSPTLGEPRLVVADPLARSVKFGNGKYVNLGQPAPFTALARWSLEAWVRIDSNPGGCGVISREYNFTTQYVQWELGFDADGTGTNDKLMTGFYAPAFGWKLVRDSVSPPYGTRFYVCSTWDGTTLTLYKGIPGSALALVGQLTPGVVPTQNGGDFFIGRRHDQGSTQWGFPGWMSNVAIYNDALTLSEAQENFSIGTGQGASPDGLVSAGAWIADGAPSLWEAIDESWPSSTEFVRSSSSPATDAFEVSLVDVGDPYTSANHLVRYRYGKSDPDERIDLTVSVVEGATVRASWTHQDIGTSPVDAVQTLTDAQADSIGDYTDLRLRFQAVKV